MIFKHILLIAFLNKPEQLFCTHLNGFKYFYLTRIILFTINHLFLDSQMVSSIAILYQYFNLGSQWKSFKYCYLTLFIAMYYNHFKLNISHLFTHS